MNILFISSEIPYPPDHGHHIRTYHTLKGLAADNSIYFVGFAKQTKELLHQSAIAPFCKSVDVFLLFAGSGWRLLAGLFLNLFSSLPFVVQRYCRPGARERIREILRTVPIDLVHVDLLHVSGYLEELGTVPKVMVNHNVESLRFRRRLSAERNPAAKVYFYVQYLKLRRYERQVCPKFDLCVAVSEVDKNVLTRLCGRGNFVTVPNGVDTDYFRPSGADKKANTLMWVGSMASPYNADAVDYFLRDIWPLIRSRNPQVTVDFVGAAPTKLLQKTAQADDRVQIRGYVEDVRPFMDAAEVFIAPMRIGSGTNIKILNALAMALPVVTTPVGAEGILSGDNESMLVAEDAQAFADKTIELLENRALSGQLARKGREVIETLYDWKVIQRENLRIYNALVPNPEGQGAEIKARPLRVIE